MCVSVLSACLITQGDGEPPYGCCELNLSLSQMPLTTGQILRLQTTVTIKIFDIFASIVLPSLWELLYHLF